MRAALLCLAAVLAPAWACEPSKSLQYQLVGTHPHDPTSFTQGLVFVGSQLAESTGQYGRSALILHQPDGPRRLALPARLFGEGLTWFEQELWQLTWRAGQLRIYRLQPLRLDRTLRYDGQGWGLTHDGTHLFLSDGSAGISIRHPDDFRELRRLQVRDGQRPVYRLNELEWWRDSLLANIWQSDRIARIAAETGCVLAWLDLTDLWPRDQRPASADVLNGIAVHPGTGHVWVTGKYWPRLYELRLLTDGEAER